MTLVLTHYFLGTDVALPRMWGFHDLLALRSDIWYDLHVVGPYPGPAEDLTTRPYVRPATWSNTNQREVRVIRGWNHADIMRAAWDARRHGIPMLMWNERSGVTFEALTFHDAVRIRLRALLLPMLFRAYRQGTIVVGTGQRATAEFERLTNGAPGRDFPYPNLIADELLTLPRRAQRNPPNFLFCGSFTRRKAVDVIDAACDRLWQEGLEFTITYAGAGPLHELLTARAQLDPRARVKSHVIGLELVNNYREADVLLLPSRHDGWGLPVHEGLARGIPVITSDACGSADLVSDIDAGRVVRAGDVEDLIPAMRELILMSTSGREQLGDRGREGAAKLTLPILADRFVALAQEAEQLFSRP